MREICPFCGSSNIEEMKHIISPFNQKDYKLMSCSECCIQFFIPLIFENVYEDEVVEEYINFHKGRRVLPPWMKELIRVIKSLNIHLEDKKILEIGAGDGINYSALHETFQVASTNYYAVEFDSKSIKQCRLKGITHIINAKFDRITASKIRKRFDIILLLEVLEHQTHPKEFIELVFDLLNQEGLIILTVPNRERYFLQYVEFQGDLPPHHFLRFNKMFFQKNFANQLCYLKDFKHTYKIKSIKAAALKLTSRFHIHHRGWILFFPLIPVIHWVIGFMAYIKGEGIVVILKK
jgi:2-polyprenyl-3-methyl-5-hydroxy-6-metoxy-1,4-benzoquinol methylase